MTLYERVFNIATPLFHGDEDDLAILAQLTQNFSKTIDDVRFEEKIIIEDIYGHFISNDGMRILSIDNLIFSFKK